MCDRRVVGWDVAPLVHAGLARCGRRVRGRERGRKERSQQHRDHLAAAAAHRGTGCSHGCSLLTRSERFVQRGPSSAFTRRELSDGPASPGPAARMMHRVFRHTYQKGATPTLAKKYRLDVMCHVGSRSRTFDPHSLRTACHECALTSPPQLQRHRLWPALWPPVPTADRVSYHVDENCPVLVTHA